MPSLLKKFQLRVMPTEAQFSEISQNGFSVGHWKFDAMKTLDSMKATAGIE